MTAYVEPVAKPCDDCPFRRNAMPGWLGAGSPESFIDTIRSEGYLPCHQTLNYEDASWKARWLAQSDGRGCAGALIMSANMCKLPRDQAMPRMPADRNPVFATAAEFIAFHRRAGARSWQDHNLIDSAGRLVATLLQEDAEDE